MRLVAFLLLLAAAREPAQPLLTAGGERLADFSVRLDLSSLDRSSPSKLATSFLRLTAAERDVAAHFHRLWRRAHLAVLARYCSPELVDRQRAAYAAARPAPADWRVGEVQRKANRPEASVRIESGQRYSLLVMERRDGSWWLREILDDRPGEGLVARPLGIPPPAPVGEPGTQPVPADRSNPLATVKSLQREMAVLGALRVAARGRMDAHFWPIVEAFYGAEFARKARQDAPEPPRSYPRRFELTEAGDAGNRVEVLVTEEVPGSGGKRSAIGHAAFDLERGAGGWRIAREWRKPAPGKPFEPVSHGFGLLFAVR